MGHHVCELSRAVEVGPVPRTFKDDRFLGRCVKQLEPLIRKHGATPGLVLAENHVEGNVEGRYVLAKVDALQ
jgi:hypothetical protein